MKVIVSANLVNSYMVKVNVDYVFCVVGFPTF
jgi:hypothetical protein